MALALYRKYRSADFSELIGQEHVTAPLMQALAAGRINHAYLFSGPRGCGKTSSARILARSLNCEQGPTPTPCGVCQSCLELAPNGSGSIDVIEIDAASHGGVEDARDLRERAYYAPVRDRYKVYIIDEAHMVTNQGFNALLKLVEEPPDFLVFIFATTEPDKVLQTIRSRTHHYPFRLIAPSVLRGHLERICAAEGVTVEPAVFPLVVRAGAGSARDSLSVLDQLLSGAGPEGVTYARAVGLLGVTDSALLDDMTDSLGVGDSAGVYATIDRVVEAGHDPRRFAADLLDRFRDLIVLDAVPDAVEKGLIDYAGDQAVRMADQARRIGLASLVRFADITHTTLTDMRGTTSPRLMLELLSARMLLPDASADSAALLQRLERLERRQGMAGAAPVVGLSAAGQPDAAPPARQPRTPPPDTASASTAPAGTAPAGPAPETAKPQAEAAKPQAEAAKPQTAAAAPQTGPIPPRTGSGRPQPAAADPGAEAASPMAPAAQQPDPQQPAAEQRGHAPDSRQPAAEQPAPAPVAVGVAETGTDSNALRQLWPEVMAALRDRSKVKWAMMNEVVIASVEGEVVNLLAPAGLAKRIADESNLSVLREVLKSVVFGSWQLTVSSAAPSNGAAVAPPPIAEEPAPEPDPEPPSRAAREAVRAPREAPAAEPPPAAPEVPEDDGVDEESDAVHSSQRSGGDAEAAALELLQTSLGARPIDAS
ncbi:MAG: DNA polymerase III subunit gamma and tau [Actinobacteria bacterium]|nr:DNA polymerase III subunit gamma and tau [Actinomycetota bacterium]